MFEIDVGSLVVICLLSLFFDVRVGAVVLSVFHHVGRIFGSSATHSRQCYGVPVCLCVWQSCMVNCPCHSKFELICQILFMPSMVSPSCLSFLLSLVTSCATLKVFFPPSWNTHFSSTSSATTNAAFRNVLGMQSTQTAWIYSFGRSGSSSMMKLLSGGGRARSDVYTLFEPCHIGDKADFANCTEEMPALLQCDFSKIERIVFQERDGSTPSSAKSHEECSAANFRVFKTIHMHDFRADVLFVSRHAWTTSGGFGARYTRHLCVGQETRYGFAFHGELDTSQRAVLEGRFWCDTSVH